MSRVFKAVLISTSNPNCRIFETIIIVTGTNLVLGKEAVKHFVRCRAAIRITLVCSSSKSEVALPKVKAEVNRCGYLDAWVFQQ